MVQGISRTWIRREVKSWLSCPQDHPAIPPKKRLLEEYAKQQGFSNVRHYTDDGISGTRFDRPGFQAMMEDIEDGKVAILCLKDMSRFERDYLQIGFYMEVIRKASVRLIALNDGVDTLKGEDEFTSFRNIMNEWYPRDTREPLNKCTSAPCGKFPSLDKQSERCTNHFGLKWLRQHSWLRILLKICHRHIFYAKSCKILKSVRITLKGYARA